MRLLTVILSALLISSCAITDLLSPSSPKIETNLAAGENVEQEKSLTKVETGTTKQNADKISNDTTITAEKVENVTNNISPMTLWTIILLAGWAIPTPLSCAKGIRNIFKVLTGKTT